MLQFDKIRKLTLGAVAIFCGTIGAENFGSTPFSYRLDNSLVMAQEAGPGGAPARSRPRRNNSENRNNRNNRNPGIDGSRDRRGGNRSPEEIIANMNPDRFARLKNSPMAQQLRERVGEVYWTKWENGDFSREPSAAEAAEQAQKAAEGSLEEISSDLTDEERADAEARLRAGSVPVFNGEGVPHYSIETEEDYYRQAMARRADVLVDATPLALRYYVRYLTNKYDQNNDGVLQRSEWENKLERAQAVDLNGDWELSEQELLFYLTRFAKDRTIFNPNPVRANAQRTNFIVDEQDVEVLIQPASAAPKRLSKEDAQEAQLANDGNNSLADMSEDDVRDVFNKDNPALESVDDDELLDVFLTEMDESSLREYAVSPIVVRGTPAWFLARDKNGDGQLTILEFTPDLTAQGLALFGKYDRDGDQMITAEEARKGPIK